MISSPLHYVGGKRSLLPDILARIPAAAAYAEPFCGGAVVGLNLAATGARVHASDIDDVVINFWHHQVTDPHALYEAVQSLLPIREALDAAGFRDLQAQLEGATGLHQAALFFICQRVSFSGLGRSGGASLSKNRLTAPILARISNLHPGPISFVRRDYRDALEEHPEAFVYLDPPYDIDCHLYGVDGAVHRAFNHLELFEALKDRTNWLLSYNDCDSIREIYRDFDVVVTAPKHVATGHRREAELLISPRRSAL